MERENSTGSIFDIRIISKASKFIGSFISKTDFIIIFNPFELIALTASMLIVNKVAHDGESNWLEGVQLLSVYLIIAASFFII